MAMAQPSAGTKRTRSQTTLDSFFPTNRLDLAASPLKQARNALKHAAASSHPHPDPSPPPVHPEPERATATPSPDNLLKRPSSPAKDAVLLAERDSKRLRHEALFSNPPLLMTSSDPSLPTSPDRRAKSVPPRPLSPSSDYPIPLLDLNNVPSSPRRSPAKFRIASLPPESPGKHLHPHIHHRPSSFPHPPTKSPSPSPFPTRRAPFPLVSDPNVPTNSLPAPSLPTTPMSPLTPLPQDHSLFTNSTPDPDPTPLPKPVPSLPLSLHPLPGPSTRPPTSDLPSPSATPTRPTPVIPSLPSSSTNPNQSHTVLPRSSGVKARMKPRAMQSPDAPSKKVKNPRNKKPPSLGPPQIRNTRSTRAAHRDKTGPLQKPLPEGKHAQPAEKGVEELFTAILSSPRPTSRLSNTQHTDTQPSQSRPPSASSQPTLPRSKPFHSQLPQPKTPRARSSQLPEPLQMHHAPRPSQSSTLYQDTTERLRDEPPPVTPANGRRRSQSLSYARPTSSSAAKASPVKPTLPIRSTSRPPSTSNSTSSAHAGASLQGAETGEKDKPAGPFDFKSIRATTPTAATTEAATQASGTNGNVHGSRGLFDERAKTPVGVRAKTPVTGATPKVKGKERAKSVDPGVFARAKTPVSAEAVVGIASPRDSSEHVPIDAGKVAPAYLEKVPNRDEDDAATPKGRKEASLDVVADLAPESPADLVQANEIARSELGVSAESDRPAVDADGDTTMLPQVSSTQAQSSFEPSEESELSELSELEDSSAGEQGTLKVSGQVSESDVPNDAGPQSGPSVPRRPPAAPLNSSLSTLSKALERLNAPMPSRPNTSLGFHRSVSSDGNDSFSSEPGASDGATGDKRPKPNGKTHVRSQSVVPTATAKGKGKAVPKTTVNGQTSTVSGQKKLKQTTLMLPPPPPVAGTRTTRLRSAALAAANASTPSTPGSSTATMNGKTPKEQEKVRQATLALAPSSGKGRAGHAATAAGQSSSGSTSTLPATSAVPGSSGLPRAGSAGPVAGAATRGTTKRAFLSSGTGRGGSSSLAKPLFGVGKFNVASGSGAPTRGGFGLAALRGRGGGSRVTHRASKVSSLPTVAGSPVKGGGVANGDEDGADAEANGAGTGTGRDAALSDDDVDMDMMVVEEPPAMDGVQDMSTKDKIDLWLRTADKDILRDLGHGSDEESGDADGLSLGDLDLDPEASAKEREERAREREARRNASRRASMASHLLAQSLSALPSAVSPPAGRGKDAKGKGRAVSSSYPSTVAAGTQDQSDAGDGEKIVAPTPPPRRAHATRLATGALSTPPNAYKEPSLRGGSGPGDAEHPSGGSAEGKGKGKAKTATDSPAQLAVLKDCRIFVDVRTDEGDDAGSLFVDMLRDLGAKISTRVGSRCTHVVFKNGSTSTLKSYRMLSTPKPHVVGIAWVVECAEQRRKVEETRFVVSLEHMNVAGTNKRRKSMLPKNFSPMATKIATSPPSSDSYRMDSALNTSLGGASRSGKGANDSLEVSSPMAVDEDGDTSLPMLNGSSIAGADDEESLPPLEKARRRRSMMPNP